MKASIALSLLALSPMVAALDELVTLDPLHDKKSSITLLEVAGSDLSIANAARVSYKRHNDVASDSDAKLIESLLRNQHETPFEQTFLQFHVRLPIFVARQWMRHRIGVSYNEQSARYTTMAHEFYVPQWRAQSEISADVANKLGADYEQQLAACSSMYDTLLGAGIKKELARCILPVSLYTQFVFGCNMRSLLHFAQLRADSHAQWEIQQYAKAMIRLAYKHFPITIEKWCAQHNIAWLTESEN